MRAQVVVKPNFIDPRIEILFVVAFNVIAYIHFAFDVCDRLMALAYSLRKILYAQVSVYAGNNDCDDDKFIELEIW